MNAGRIIIKAEMDNSDLKKGLKENEAMIEASSKKSELAKYKENINYWKQRKKETQSKIDSADNLGLKDLYKKNMEDIDNHLGFWENQLKELTGETSEIASNMDKTSEKASFISKGLELAKKTGKGLASAFLSVANFAARALISVIGISVLIGGLALGISALAMGFKEAFGNEQVRQDLANIVGYIKYIIFAIGKALVPTANSIADVVAKIVSLIAKAFQYIAVIIKAWTGVDVYEETGVQELSTGLKEASGTAKELRKTLAGFDEMNVLNKNGSVGALGGIGGAGGGLPAFDISSLENVKLPDWLEWLKNNGPFVRDVLIAMVGAFAGIAAGASTLMSIGIGIALLGIVKTIEAIIKFVNDPSWSNFADILIGISIALTGIGTALIVMNANNPIGWISIAVGVVTGLVGEIIKWKDGLEKTKIHTDNLKKSQEDLNTAIQEYEDVQTKANDAFVRAEEEQKKLEELEKKHHITAWKLYQEVQNGTKSYFDLTDAEKEVYKQYGKMLDAMKDLEDATEVELDSQEKVKRKELEVQLTKLKSTKSYDEYRDAVVKAYKDGTISATEAAQLIDQALKEIDKSSKDTFTKNIPESIKKGLDPGFFGKILENFKIMWNGFINGLKASSSIKITADTSGVQTKHAAGAIAYTRLASGGIINQPGRGVPLAGAIGGERGAEGVFPLTDSQQMELLGATIGKYITVAPTIPVYVGNRMVAREIRKINEQDNFAFNK